MLGESLEEPIEFSDWRTAMVIDRATDKLRELIRAQAPPVAESGGSDTPRTDALVNNQTLPQAMGFVPADFARELERELSAETGWRKASYLRMRELETAQILKDEAIREQLALALGWTRIYGGHKDNGMYLRGYLPGDPEGRKLAQSVPTLEELVNQVALELSNLKEDRTSAEYELGKCGEYSDDPASEVLAALQDLLLDVTDDAGNPGSGTIAEKVDALKRGYLELLPIRKQLDAYIENEAACCPEDVGFKEYIIFMESKLVSLKGCVDKLQEALAALDKLKADTP